MKTRKGFTLVELLIVIAIIGVLSSIVLVGINNARKKAKDVRRLTDMRQIQTAFELYYYSNNNTYPVPNDATNGREPACGGWDVSSDGDFITALKDGGFLPRDLSDSNDTLPATCGNYMYVIYGAGYAGCDVSKGNYYVLGIVDMESSGRPYPGSPGWSCPTRDWQLEFDWVRGGFLQ